MFRVKQILAAISLCLISVLGYTPTVQAAQSSSSSYGVSEVNFGSGGSLQSCSTAYCSKQSAGELVVGETNSTGYRARGGANTNREPLLEMSVSGGTIDLGVVDASSVKFGSTTFSIRTFPAYGYSVVVDGAAPKHKTNGYTLPAMASGGASAPGTPQFGINLRQNTAPAVGANAQQLPDNTFAFGAPAGGYGTQNNFRFVAGETVASSPKGTGQTNFTLSMIANVGTTTPAGVYAGRLVLIAVPTF